MECMAFLTNFRQIFASFTPTVGSVTTSLLEIMVPRYAFSEKHKNMLKYRKIFEVLHFKLEYLQFLAIFGNFWANFCLIHSSCWFYDDFFA